MKTAVIQMNSSERKSDNIDRAVHFVEIAIRNQAKFILLPEVFNYRGKPDPQNGFWNEAETIPGESTRPLISLAKKWKVFILAGSICEREKDTKKVYNTSALIFPSGKIVRYKKIHLFDAVLGKQVIRESTFFNAGQRSVMAKVDQFKVGLTICYDLRFPLLFRKYFVKGAHILCVPSSFTKVTGTAHWEVLLRARAIENLCYVVAPNQIGKDSRGIEFFGNSMIVNPWGEVVSRASADKKEVIYAEISMDDFMSRRKVLTAFDIF